MVQIISRADKITTRSRQKIFYSDFGLNFDLNPQTGLLAKLINEDAIKRSIVNLVMTTPGERFYHSEIGGGILARLFDPVDNVVTSMLQTAITSTIHNFEPRAQNLNVIVTPFPQDNYYDVTVQFTAVNIPDPIILQFPLTSRIR